MQCEAGKLACEQMRMGAHRLGLPSAATELSKLGNKPLVMCLADELHNLMFRKMARPEHSLFTRKKQLFLGY